MLSPIFLSEFSFSIASFIFSIIIPSVISISTASGLRLYFMSRLRMFSIKFGCLSCIGEMFMDIMPLNEYFCCQFFSVQNAVLRTQSPISSIIPVSSASGMNIAGPISPSSLSCQRINASKPRKSPVFMSNCGWYTR